MDRLSKYGLLLAVVILCYCVLCFYQATSAQPPQAKEPFANSVEQRFETVKVLAEIRDLLKEQNALLRSGEVKVIVVQPKK
jgi:large-conductance mechanosensitive channel